MKTKWEYSIKNEAMKIVHDAHYLVTGFYKINNFIVLPYGDNDASPATDWFPDLPFYKIPRFWERVKKVDVYQIPIIAEPKLIDQVCNLLQQENISEPKSSSLMELWSKVEKDLLEAVEDLVFGKRGNISGITIYPTHYGNTTSFGAPLKFPADLKIFAREDAGIYSIADAVLASVTRRNMEAELGASWIESETFVDWNLLHGPVAHVLKKHQTEKPNFLTTNVVRSEQNARLIKKSQEFYKKLGIPSLEKVFDNRKIELSGQSKKLFNLLLEHQNEVVTIDGISSILFENRDDFSLYAISKAIERLRNKLEANGISGNYIQAFRGQGYLLRN